MPELDELEDNGHDLRKVFRVTDSGEEQVRMSALQKDDRFRVVTDDPKDCMHGRGAEVYVAESDAVQDGHGVWGVDVGAGSD